MASCLPDSEAQLMMAFWVRIKYLIYKKKKLINYVHLEGNVCNHQNLP